MSDESVEPASNEISNGLSRRQLLGGVTGVATVSGVGGFLLGSHVGNPLEEDGPGGVYPLESSESSLVGTFNDSGMPEYPGVLHYDDEVLDQGSPYFYDYVDRFNTRVTPHHHYQFVNGGGYYAWVDFYENVADDEPYLSESLTATSPHAEGTGLFKKAIITIELVSHRPTIEIIRPDDYGDTIHRPYTVEFWLDGLATSPRFSVGYKAP